MGRAFARGSVSSQWDGGECSRRRRSVALSAWAVTRTGKQRRQHPIAPSLRQPLHWLHASFTRRRSVVHAKSGTSQPCIVDDKEWNEMQPIATEIKVSPLLATRNEAKQGHSEVMLAHRVRVSGGPNEATVVSFPASQLGVNEAKQGQMGPGINPFHTSALISPGRGCEVPAFAGTTGVSRERWGGVYYDSTVLLRTAHLLAVMPVRCCCFPNRRRCHPKERRPAGVVFPLDIDRLHKLV